jgi:hypothetical protein
MFNQFEGSIGFPVYPPRAFMTTPTKTAGKTPKLSGFKKMWKKTISIFGIIITMLLVLFQSSSIGGMAEIEVTDDIQQELDYLFHFMSLPDQRPQDFVAGNLADLIAFVAEKKAGDRLFHAGKRFRANSAYYEFHITKSLKQVLGYAFNPGIPFSAIAPASVRSCRSERRQVSAAPQLWEHLDAPKKTLIVRGIDYVVNTPDLFSGAYHAFSLKNMQILFKYRGRNVLVSISKQDGASDVGRKGLILGPDDNWDYIYTGLKGLTRSGLEWVRSYMYDSATVAIYYETESREPRVKCGIFKWVRAGWAGLNMVRSFHIQSGMQRFAKAFKQVIEFPRLPVHSVLKGIYSKIEKLPPKELRKRTKNYLDILAANYSHLQDLEPKWRRYLLDVDHYLSQLNNEKMQALLFTEFIKQLIGKTRAASLAIR